MNSYNKPNAAPAAVTVNTSSTAAKAIATPLAIRVGYRLTNTGSNTIYIYEVPVGTSAPTVATVIASPSFVLAAGQYIEVGARDSTDIYTGAAATATATIQELV
jgi:hypothetical protein